MKWANKIPKIQELIDGKYANNPAMQKELRKEIAYCKKKMRENR